MKEVYLDYAATTFPSDEVLNSFINASKIHGNPNSLHKLGKIANDNILKNTNFIANLFNIKDNEIIYTSGASESNNLALKGICLKHKKGHIITTRFEHSSIIATLNYLTTLGFEVDFLETNEFGLVDIDNLKSLIRNDTILISIASVNSEIGNLQPIEEIGCYLKENYKDIIFHVDATQGIGKIKLNLDNIDLLSMSAHKIFGIKGIGLLIKKDNIKLVPLIHGGKSTTIYRSGTPQSELIASLKTALEFAYIDIDKKYMYVESLKNDVKEFLNGYDNIKINSNDYTIPYILNFSFLGVDSNKFQELMSNNGIYLSTKTACSISDISESVYSLTKDLERSKSSIRISFSYKTTKEEINYFKSVFDKVYKEINDGNYNN
ncbi:MAG: cysteine desulfurase [Bacilli bacterium]|nr:cysteine desulfurase [Bacilli bacterium]